MPKNIKTISIKENEIIKIISSTNEKEILIIENKDNTFQIKLLNVNKKTKIK